MTPNPKPLFTGESFKSVFSPPLGEDDLDFIAERANSLHEERCHPQGIACLKGHDLVGYIVCGHCYDKLEAENTRLREALEWYADEKCRASHTSLGPCRMIVQDNGEKARAALEGK